MPQAAATCSTSSTSTCNRHPMATTGSGFWPCKERGRRSTAKLDALQRRAGAWRASRGWEAVASRKAGRRLTRCTRCPCTQALALSANAGSWQHSHGSCLTLTLRKTMDSYSVDSCQLEAPSDGGDSMRHTGLKKTHLRRTRSCKYASACVTTCIPTVEPPALVALQHPIHPPHIAPARTLGRSYGRGRTTWR